jgi:hypothetical protein
MKLMIRSTTYAWFLPALLGVTLLFTMFSAPVSAAEDVLTLVPEDALGFAVINRLSDVSEKLAKVTQNLKLPLPDLLTMWKMKLGVTEGLNEQGNLLLAVLPSLENQLEPQPMIALPVMDYGQFSAAFDLDAAADIQQIEIAGQTILVAEKGSYAVMMNTENRVALKRLLEGEKKRPVELEPLAQWIGQNDGTVVLFEAGLKMVVEKMIQGLEQAKQFAVIGVEDSQKEQVAAALDMYVQMLDIVRTEVYTAAKGLRIDKDGNFVFGARHRFTEDGRLAELSSTTKASTVDLLAGLPGGPYVGIFSSAWSADCSAALAEWSVSMMQNNPAFGGMKLSEEEAEEYAQASLLSMQGLRRMAMRMTPGTEDEKLLANFLVVFDVDSVDKYLVNYKKALQVWQELMQKSESPMPMKMVASEVTVHGLKGLKITMDMQGLLDAQGAPPEAKGMIERMFGQGGKITVHVIAADKNTILLSYAPAAVIEQKIANYLKNKTQVADEPGVAKTAGLLLRNPDMVAYLSPRGAVAWFGRLMDAVLPPEVEKPELAEFPETAPIGISAKIVAGGLEAEMVVPAELPQAVMEYAQQMRQ